MRQLDAVQVMQALAQDSRLTVFRLLIKAGTKGKTAGEISELTQIPPSSLSFHLKEMTHANILNVTQHGRYMIYSVNLNAVKNLIGYLTENCCAEMFCQLNPPVRKKYNVLILCTGNSARSILAEIIFNQYFGDMFSACSAGSHPAEKVNPYALDIAQQINYPATTLYSKSWDAFTRQDAPAMDYIITVCDQAAGQKCPLWPGQPVIAHWGFADPAAFEGTEDEMKNKFIESFNHIKQRIEQFASLPLDRLDRLAAAREINNLR